MVPTLTCIFHEKPKQSQVFFLEDLPSVDQLKEVVFLADNNSKHILEKYFDSFPQAKQILIPAGEFYKTQDTKQLIEEQLFKNKCGKQTTLIGIGGGVICDLAGYVCATYLRGIDLILIPTTLLAMVDASFGGKNGVNTSFGKNLLGTFYPARQIWIDLQAISTWAITHIQEGMTEIIKKALIADSDFFAVLEKNADLFLSKDNELLKTCIKKSLEIKAFHVQNDLTDSGVRRSLNFGHTIAHALELSSKFSLSHGQAVAIGLCVETWISGQFFPEALLVLPRLKNLLKKLKFSLSIPGFITIESLQEACLVDKKNTKDQKRLVLLKKLGAVEPFENRYCTPISEKLFKQSLEWMFEEFKEPFYVY